MQVPFEFFKLTWKRSDVSHCHSTYVVCKLLYMYFNFNSLRTFLILLSLQINYKLLVILTFFL